MINHIINLNYINILKTVYLYIFYSKKYIIYLNVNDYYLYQGLINHKYLYNKPIFLQLYAYITE